MFGRLDWEMERRSWLWRRKSSEKSPGETESSGSVSSGRFSDDQVIISMLWRLISHCLQSIWCLIFYVTIYFTLDSWRDVFLSIDVYARPIGSASTEMVLAGWDSTDRKMNLEKPQITGGKDKSSILLSCTETTLCKMQFFSFSQINFHWLSDPTWNTKDIKLAKKHHTHPFFWVCCSMPVLQPKSRFLVERKKEGKEKTFLIWYRMFAKCSGYVLIVIFCLILLITSN